MTATTRVGIIGGGAAGFFGAIACAEAFPQIQVRLFEAGPVPLTKVRISGGGRCNVTHHCFDPAQLVQYYPRGSRALRGPFSHFQPKDTVAWFQQRGVSLKTEGDGRMFPVTDDSDTIVDCLLETAQRLNVQVETRAPVTAIATKSPGFCLTLKSGRTWDCDRLLLATGSNPSGYRLATNLGHTIASPVPSLFTFNIANPYLQALAGIAVDPATVSLHLPTTKPQSQTGPVLITHWGFSGPAVLKLSAWEARSLYEHRYRGEVRLNWLPEHSQEDLRQLLLQLKREWGKRSLSTHCPLPLPKRLWQHLVLQQTSLPIDLTWANLSKKQLQQLIQTLSQDTYPLTGKGAFKEEFVTCGGVCLKEINFKTMESRQCPGLHLAGEILDIDGITGGFNFQSAWTTGWLAGQTLGLPSHTSE